MLKAHSLVLLSCLSLASSARLRRSYRVDMRAPLQTLAAAAGLAYVAAVFPRGDSQCRNA